MITDVTHIGGTQECIADGMDEHIGIAVTQQPVGVLYPDAAQPKLTALHQTVHVISESYSYLHLVSLLMSGTNEPRAVTHQPVRAWDGQKRLRNSPSP